MSRFTPRRLARLLKGGTPASQVATRTAFAIIILFVLAQVGWWLIFQQRYMAEVTRQRLAAWQHDALTANALLEVAEANAESAAREARAGSEGAEAGASLDGLAPDREAAEASAEGLRAELAGRYPHLRLSGERFVVDEAARREFTRSQDGYMRMFAFEVPFFVLVTLLSLVFIASRLRNERELKRRQQNFMSAVTHEFKTPISTLRLLIETALLRPLPADKLREYLGRMAGEVARLEQTSEQVLASARLEQSSEAQLLAPHDLSELVSETVERLRPGLEARGAVLDLSRPAQPLPVSVDPDAFTVVLGNLLDNAVKYSPGPVKPVQVRLERSGDLALVHVEDSGIGIGEGEEERIFDRFYRSGDEMTRESAGMGLGLHLVRSTVEAMNGWVRCANREGGSGSRFTVVLPQRLEAAPASRAQPEARNA